MLEERFIYYPTRYPEGDWETSALPFPVEDCHLTTRDGETLHAWFAAAGPAAPHLLYLHGNGGNLSHRADFLHRLTRLPASVLMVDYRGYGRSTGKPGERGLYLDAEAAYRYLVEERQVPPRRLFLLGKSLGGAVAIELATRVPCAGLIVQSTFTSIRAMARRLVTPPLPLHWLVRNRFDSLARIGQVTAPKLILHGRGDRLVPFRMGRALYEAAPEPRHFHDLGPLDHNDVMDAGAAYDAALGAFLRRYAGPEPRRP